MIARIPGDNLDIWIDISDPVLVTGLIISYNGHIKTAYESDSLLWIYLAQLRLVSQQCSKTAGEERAFVLPEGNRDNIRKIRCAIDVDECL